MKRASGFRVVAFMMNALIVTVPLYSMEGVESLNKKEIFASFVNKVREIYCKGFLAEKKLFEQEKKNINFEFKQLLQNQDIAETEKIGRALEFIKKGANASSDIITMSHSACSKLRWDECREHESFRCNYVSLLIENKEYSLAALLIGCGYHWWNVSTHARENVFYKHIEMCIDNFYKACKSRDLKNMTKWLLRFEQLRIPLVRILDKNKNDIFPEIFFTQDEFEVEDSDLKKFIEVSYAVGFDLNRTDILVYIVRRKNMNFLESLVDKGITLSSRNLYGITALQEAVYIKDTEKMQYLINRGAPLNVVDYFGQTLLHDLCGEYVDTFEILFNKNFVNKKDNRKRTPLHAAAARQDVELIGKLLAAGADVNACDVWKSTPLHSAIRGENERHILTRLKQGEKGFDKDLYEVREGSLWISIQTYYQQNDEKQAQIVELLLKRGAKINESDYKGITPLHLAVGSCSSLVIKKLLENGAKGMSCDNCGYTPLDYALGTQRGFFLKDRRDLLVELFKNRSTYRQPKTLFKKNSKGETVLHHLVGHAEDSEEDALWLIDMFMHYKADINAQDNDGRTPLHRAVQLRKQNFVACLLKHGADKMIRDKSGKTPIEYAFSDEIKSLLVSQEPEENKETLTSKFSRWSLAGKGCSEEKRSLLKKD